MDKRRKNIPDGLKAYILPGVRCQYANGKYYLYAGYPKKDPVTGRYKTTPGSAVGMYTEKDGFIPAAVKEADAVSGNPDCGVGTVSGKDAGGTETVEAAMKTMLHGGDGAWGCTPQFQDTGKPKTSRAERRRRDREEKKKREMFAQVEKEMELLRVKFERNDTEIQNAVKAGADTAALLKEKEKLTGQTVSCIKRLGENPYPKHLLYLMDRILQEMLDDTEGRTDYFSSPSDFTKNRCFPLGEVVRFLMCSGAASADRAVFRQFCGSGNVPSASALCQQRAKLKPQGMRHVFQRLVELAGPPVPKCWNGYRLLAVDGTDTNVAYDPDADSFVDNGDARGYNQLHVNCLYDILNQTYCGALIQPKGRTNEPGAAASILRDTVLPGKTIVMGDRGYGAMNLFETIRRKENAEYLIRVKEDYIREVRELPMEELDVDITFTIVTSQTKENKEKIRKGVCKYLSGKSRYGKDKKCVEWDFEDGVEVTIRIVRFLLPSGKWETLATSLPREQFPPSVLRELYNLRYGIEHGFRHLKYSLALSFYHSRKEEFIQQEIYACLCAYNICSLVIGYAAACYTADNRQKEGRETKYEYKINCSMGIYIVMEFIRNNGRVNYDVCGMIQKYRIPIRTGRQFKRNLKSRSWEPFVFRAA